MKRLQIARFFFAYRVEIIGKSNRKKDYKSFAKYDTVKNSVTL